MEPAGHPGPGRFIAKASILIVAAMLHLPPRVLHSTLIRPAEAGANNPSLKCFSQYKPSAANKQENSGHPPFVPLKADGGATGIKKWPPKDCISSRLRLAKQI